MPNQILDEPPLSGTIETALHDATSLQLSKPYIAQAPTLIRPPLKSGR